MTHPLAPLARSLAAREVRYVLIGVSGANLYGPAGQAIFSTEDFDLFLPPDPENLVRAWAACEDAALDLWLTNEPLDRPRDRWLAERIVERRALTRAAGGEDVRVDLTLVMKGFEFDTSGGATEGSIVPRDPQRRARATAEAAEGLITSPLSTSSSGPS